ncbi:MAG: TfoX family protein [Alphaproteobacteria bacterium]|nr:TfoX family protein [Alphaproteobacteria bacterium]
MVAQVQVPSSPLAMAWRKAPPGLIQLFDRAIPADRGVERRKMFGYPAAFLGGRLFAGLHQEDFILRLSETDRARLLALPGARPFEPMQGRVMRDYAVLPPALVADERALSRWIDRALAHAATLPAKPRKPAPKKKARAV